jgi:ribosomal protein L29
MSSRLFGWSYPPGVSSVPGDEPFVCRLCGKGEDDCKCEECKECGDIGCLRHVDEKELRKRLDESRTLAWNLEAELKERYAKNPAMCRECKKPLSFEDREQCDAGLYHPACESIVRAREETW